MAAVAVAEPVAQGTSLPPWTRGWAPPPAGPCLGCSGSFPGARCAGGGCGCSLAQPMVPRVAERAVPAPVCFCGNVFLPDATYCRKCGKKRPGATPEAQPATAQLFRSPSPLPTVQFEATATPPFSASTGLNLGGNSSAPLQPPAQVLVPSRQPSPQRLIIPSAGSGSASCPSVAVWHMGGQAPIPQAAQQRPSPVVRAPSVTPVPPVQMQSADANAGTIASGRPSSGRARGIDAEQRHREGLLARIDGVVSEMERDLSEDLVMCVGSPLRDLTKNQAGAAAGSQLAANVDLNGFDTESTIDLLDRQILAIEQRREACEMRQAHLGELRRIVAEGQGWSVLDKRGTGGSRGDLEGSSGSRSNLSTVIGGSEEGDAAAIANKIALLEADRDLLKKQVHDLEQIRFEHERQLSTMSREKEDLLRSRAELEAQCESRLGQLRSAAEAVEGGERRIQIAEVAANERFTQAALEAQQLQARLIDAETAAEQSRMQSVEAVEAQAAAEADLRCLEDNSRAVLLDCRALQAKVRELEVERTAYVDVQAGFEEERKALNQRVHLLEDERAELEVFRQSLRDENHNLSTQHSQQLLSKEEEASRELTKLRCRERVLCEELAQVQEKNDALIAAEAGRRSALEAKDRELADLRHEEQNARMVDRSRVAELDQELADARGAATALEVSVRKFGADRIKVAELEQELAEAINQQENLSRQLHQHRGKNKELEQRIGEYEVKEARDERQITVLKGAKEELERQLEEELLGKEHHLKQQNTHKLKISELEQLLEVTRGAGDTHIQNHNSLRAQVAELERQLIDAHDTREQHHRHSQHLQGKHSELESNLEQLMLANESHIRTHGTLNEKVRSLEAELAEALAAKDRHHGSLKSKLLELEETLAEAIRDKEHHSRQHHLTKGKLSDLEQQIAEFQLSHESHVKSHGVKDRRLAELEGTVADQLQQLEHANKHHSLVKGKNQELQRLLDEHQLELSSHRDQHSKTHSKLQEHISELEVQLAQALDKEDKWKREHSAVNMRHNSAQDRASQLEEELKSAKENHSKQHAVSTRRIQELEKLMQTVEGERDSHQRNHSSLQNRLREIEDQLDGAVKEKDSHGRRHETLQRRIAELEAELDSAAGDREQHYGKHQSLQSKVLELEEKLALIEGERDQHKNRHGYAQNQLQELEEKLALIEGERDQHKNRHGNAQSQIQELEEKLLLALGEKDQFSRSHSTARSELQELEDKLQLALSEKDDHAKLKSTHLTRIQELEDYLRSAEEEKGSHQRQHMSLQERYRELEDRIEQVTGERDSHRRNHSSQQGKLRELEEQLLAALNEKDDHKNNHASSQEQLRILERKLEEALHNHGELGIQHKKAIEDWELRLRDAQDGQSSYHSNSQRKIQELEEELRDTRLEAQRQIETRTLAETRWKRDLEQVKDDLEKERAISRRIQKEMEDTRRAAEKVESDAQEALLKADEVKRTREREWEERLNQADLLCKEEQQKVRDLERRSSQAPKTIQRPSVTRRTTGSAQGALIGKTPSNLSLNWKSPRPLMDSSMSLLPQSSDPFVQRCRDQISTVEGALKSAGETHFAVIGAQLQSAVDRAGGRDIWEGIHDYERKQELDLERRMKERTLQAAFHDLKALTEETQTQHQLTPTEREHIAERIALEIQRVQDDMRFLQSHSPLHDPQHFGEADIPYHLLEGLVDLQRSNWKARREWDGDISPMHWSAQKGRRDIVEFLLRQEGSRHWIHARDKQGRTPLYYAERFGNKGLAHFMRLEASAGDVAPLQPIAIRPANITEVIPEAYEKVLEQVETQGWHTVTWTGGYSMLHWAASKGHSDFCAYLINLDADPHATDDSGRTPFRCAMEAGHQEVARFIQEQARHFSAKRHTDGHSARGVPSVRSPSGAGPHSGFGSEASSRPDRRIPKAYMEVMEQIDRIGWDKMQWARGFTLLHWAAKHDWPELCARFMAQGGDPYHQDDTNKNAFDYAREKDAHNALAQLERDPPKTWQPIDFGVEMISTQSMDSRRKSFIVDARPRRESQYQLERIPSGARVL